MMASRQSPPFFIPLTRTNAFLPASFAVNHSHRQSFHRAVIPFHFYMQKYLRLLNVFESSSSKGFDAKIFLLRFA
jgi:hypothetical protein